jgi:transposase
VAAPGLPAYNATANYVDALPPYRQIRQFARLGVEIDRTTLANGMGMAPRWFSRRSTV